MVKVESGLAKRRGRKPLPPELAQSELLHVRVNPELYARIVQRAEAEQLRVGELLRAALRVWVDSPGDLARAVIEDPRGRRSRLVVRGEGESRGPARGTVQG